MPLTLPDILQRGAVLTSLAACVSHHICSIRTTLNVVGLWRTFDYAGILGKSYEKKGGALMEFHFGRR